MIRLLCSFLIGCLLGLYYGFLRPLRPRWLGDLLFVAGLFHGWIQLIFGLCGADPRFAYTAMMALGCFVWEAVFGHSLKPVFSFFWKGIFRIFSGFFLPFKKLCKKTGNLIKFFFASGKKWVTIKCNKHSPKGAMNRRHTHGKA